MRSIKNVILVLMLTLLTGCAYEDSETIIELPKGELLVVHYIDVGQADATLVTCGDDAMLIDGGNVEDSSLIYSYLKEQGIGELDYVIATHAHEDHIGGLAGALNYARAECVYCPVTDFDTEAFRNFEKYVNLQGEEIVVPEVGEEFSLGNASVEILGVNTLEDDPNNTSIVMRMDFGNTSFLFCGDAEQEAEKLLLETGVKVRCDVLKVPHHGSDSSLSLKWLLAIQPQYGIISVGENNDYGHPDMDVLNRLERAGVKVHRTDQEGHIICISDGENIKFETEKTVGIGPTTETIGEIYVLNINTMKFHYSSCLSVEKMKEKNKMNTDMTREELLEKGYEPCGNCKP